MTTINSPDDFLVARARAHLSYSALERMTGIDRHVIAGIEQGDKHLERLAQAIATHRAASAEEAS